jgi:hypothetical protein
MAVTITSLTKGALQGNDHANLQGLAKGETMCSLKTEYRN